jgi:sortase A
MTTELKRDPVGPRSRRRLHSASARAWQLVIVVTIVLLGIAVMLYPTVASWFSAQSEGAAVALHADLVEGVGEQVRGEALEAADAYNRGLTQGLLIDPFGTEVDADAVTLDEDALDYLDQLSLDPTGIMSQVTIPRIGVDLPVYHGATEQTLRMGVGHLYGSSLPVGGTGTHAVLTGHSGLPESTLFTELNELEPGDEFVVDTYGRKLVYRVTDVNVVDPTDIDMLRVVPGEDLITLVTCTPIGINSQRLLVQAERVSGLESADIAADATDPVAPTPWWAWTLGAGLMVWFALFARAIILRRRTLADKPGEGGA